VHLQAAVVGLQDSVTLFPVQDNAELIAAINFQQVAKASADELVLAEGIFTRLTNRKVGERKLLDSSFYEDLKHVSQIDGVELFYVDDDQNLAELADIIAECDKVRLLNKLGHEEFYHEIRWNRDEALQTKDGVELASVDISQGEMAGFKVAGDWNAVELLTEWNKGNAFKKMSVKSVINASGMVLFTVPEFTNTQLLQAGRAVQKAWIRANQQGLAVHPMLSPAFFFSRLIHGEGVDLTAKESQNLLKLRERFLKIFPIANGLQRYEVFLMKVAVADAQAGPRSLRKDKSELFISV
jgi:hypothetical protein